MSKIQNQLAKQKWIEEMMNSGLPPVACLFEAYRKHRKMGVDKFYAGPSMNKTFEWLGCNYDDLKIASRSKQAKHHVDYWDTSFRSNAWIAERIEKQL